jgi:putative transposase
VKRETVAHLRTEHEMSEQRVPGDWLPADSGALSLAADSALRKRLRALAQERRRFGYRRHLIVLRRKGFVVNHKRLFRFPLYREKRLKVRKRAGRKRASGTGCRWGAAAYRRSLDFVSDQLVCGRRPGRIPN